MTVATLGSYAYARSDGGIYVNLYLEGEASIDVEGTQVRIVQQTRYPWDGRVKLTVEPDQPRAFTLHLRVPGWCRGLESIEGLYRSDPVVGLDRVRVKINGQPMAVTELHKGYLRVHRLWKSGDAVELRLPMPVTRITSHPKVAANAGRVALKRGPIVYCLEAIDHGGSVRGLYLPEDQPLVARHRPDLLGGVTVLEGTAMRADDDGGRPIPLLAVPYAAWSNREPGEMDIWLLERPRQ
jgi:DUF1680 family protein